MGTCIICGTQTDGAVCATHEQDVAFVFEGTSPNQLTPERYYRGTVDGYADFGVFVDVGDSVTGLLHESELDQRLESLHWEPGDEVFVQVDHVQDNGNVDLSWSIRQSADEFRGLLVDTPEGDRLVEDDGDDEDGDDTRADDGADAQVDSASTPARDDRGHDHSTSGSSDDADEPEDASGAAADDAVEPSDEDDPDATEAVGEVRQRQSDGGTTTGSVRSAEAEPEPEADVEPDPADAAELSDREGDLVRVEGEVTDVHQTSGPTVFHLRDATGTVECAAFDGAGVRAYPEVEVGDYVRLDGEVEERRGEIQVETETLLVLTGEEREAVADEIDAAIEAAVRPEAATFVADEDPVEPLADGLVEAATANRRSVAEDRPVVIRPPATADGYAAGAAVERASRQRARDDADGAEPDYHAVDRRPLDDRVYGMDAVTADLTRMLQDRERHGEQLPLLVLVGIGSSSEAIDAASLLDVYGVERVVLDVARPDEGVEAVGDPVVNPHLAGIDDDLAAAALGSALGATVAPDVAADLAHVPSIGYWDTPPAAYLDAAEDAGVNADERRAIREALALEAHYQSYNDKRELVDDVLFEGAPELAGHVAEQFREKLETELATASENLVVREVDGVRVGVLDTDAFTHRFDFPPTDLLLDELHRQGRGDADAAAVTVGAGEDELSLRSTEPLDVRAVAERASERVPGVEAVGGRDGHVEYLSGVREDAIEAVIAAVAEELAS